MKRKLFIALILITTITISLTANPQANPTSGFDVKTTISPVNNMKITNAEVDVSTYHNPNNDFKGTVVIASSGEGQNMDASGNVAFSAYISTLSNNRKGYSVMMSATPLTSTSESFTATINYTVSSGGASFFTKTDTNAVEVIEVTNLTELDTESLPISVAVERNEYDSAVAGTYVGTITFEYIASN